jgi:hypothetical protein
MIRDQQDLLSAAKAIVTAMENNAAPCNLKASLREVETVEISASLLLALSEAVESKSEQSLGSGICDGCGLEKSEVFACDGTPLCGGAICRDCLET